MTSPRGPQTQGEPPRPHPGSEHGAAHGHIHAHGPPTAAYAIGILLNVVYVVVEAGFGAYTGSLALMADAGHNFADVLSLVVSGGAALLARRSPSGRFTYGMGASTYLAALFNAMLLLVITGGIIWAAVGRIAHPAPLELGTLMVVAAAGVVVNGLTATFFLRHQHHDLNARGAFLHMVADAAVSAAVIVAALLIRATGWLWLDAATSIAIAVVIMFSTGELFSRSVRMALQAVPIEIEPEEVRRFLLSQEGVTEAHDLHIWAISTTETALTAHLVMPSGHPGDHFLAKLADELDERFHVAHATLQVETGNATPCRLATGHA